MSQLEDIVNKFLNELRSNGYPGMVGQVTPTPDVIKPIEYDKETGWFYDTPTGAPRSEGVDELRKELYEKGYTVIAEQIPVFHCIAYWLKAPFPKTAFVNITKVEDALRDFGVYGAALDDRIEDNLVDNILWQTKSVLGSILNTNRDYPKTEYRGQYGKDGFVKVIWDAFTEQPDFSPNLPPNYKELAANNAIQRPGAQAFSAFQSKGNGIFDTVRVPVPGTERFDHYVYNIWWEGQTDDDVTRHWRNWAVAVGAKIAL